MKKTNRFNFLIICLVLLSVSLILAIPTFNLLHGNVKIITNETELDIPEGTNISAFIDNKIRGSNLVNSESNYIINIDGTDEDDGKEITFKIGDMIADQILIYSSMGDDDVNLTITDLDNDGYSVGYVGYDGENKDCDDTDADINVKNTYYLDFDEDGYGDDSNTTQACSAPTGYVSDNTDCNDANAGISPGATDVCGNGVDENCDGVDASCPTTGGGTTSGGGGGGTCYTKWKCTDWSYCIDEEQTRTCEKEKKYCRVREDKPDEIRLCSVQEEVEEIGDEEEELIDSGEEEPPQGFAGITGAVTGALGTIFGTTIVIIFILGLIALTIIVVVARKRKK